MNQTALDILEYKKIKSMLEGYTVSSMGKALVEKLQPEHDLTIIESWLEETEEARRLMDKGSSVPLSSLIGIDKVMEKLGKVVALQPDELWTIRNVLVGAGKMIQYMKNRLLAAPKVASYASSMYELEDLSTEIERCILDNRIDDKASPELARTRKRMAIVEERIESKLESILRSPAYKDMLQDAVVSMRGGSYVIPFKREHKRAVDGAVLDISSSGSTVFIEPAAIKALKSELDELRIEEEKEVFRILSTLTGIAEGYRKELLINVQTMAHYDFLFAKAKLANSMKAVLPVMNHENRIVIRSGRHPLIGSQAVPLDFEIGADYRALVITGPNTGGKTVVLKTVGLFCLMAQSGLHVPAEQGTKLSVFTDILADIGDGQSIEQSLSTFSSHIRNIISIIKCAGPDTLVIMDELGTGTDPAEGMGLAVAVMERLYQSGCIMVCTTHYSEIKEFARTTPGFKNGCMLFDTRSLLPLYRLSIGIPGESNAFLISLRLGMDPALIERAHKITYKEDRHYEKPDASQASQEAEALVNEEVLLSNEESRNTSIRRYETKKRIEKQKVESAFKLGDCVFVTSMNRTGIVCELENARGEVGVMVMKKRFTVNKKRLRPFIDGKDLYPEDYNLDIVLETKDYRKTKKIMSKHHVEGLTLEH
ncbi:MAG: hypothetical protein N2376_02085 [Clostridia bacterium]|nr:hypothetical protein [Clostridia bacterium]